MNRSIFVVLLALTAGCTPGGIGASAGGAAPVAAVTTVKVSIAAYGQGQTSSGPALGFSPLTATVSVGSGIRFANVDNTSHTASSIAGTSFPATSPLSFAATSLFGNTLSSGWSSGTLQAGAVSQVLLVDKPGTYLYGCFFHYSGTMRGTIVAQ